MKKRSKDKKTKKCKLRNIPKKALLVVTRVWCAILAIVIVGLSAFGIFNYSKKGDYTLLEGDTKKGYSTVFSEVKTYPNGKKSIGRAWRDGMIGGNGKLGFINAGSPYSDTIIYQDVDYIMPTDRDRYDMPDLTGDLEVARQAIINLDDSYVAADCINWNYNYAFHPGQELRLTQDKHILYSDYIRWTDYETGEVGVKYKDSNGVWSRKTFTSRTDDVTITQIGQSSTGSKVNMTISLDDVSGMYKYGSGDENKIQYKKLVADDCSYIAQVAHYPDYEKSSLANGGYAGVTYIVVVGGTKEKVQLDPDERWWGDEEINVGDQNPAVKITDADAVYLITKNDRTFDMGDFDDFASAESYELLDTLLSDCKSVADKYTTDGDFSYDDALAPSAKEHGEMFNSLSFTLGDSDTNEKSNEALLKAQKLNPNLSDELVERLYNQARYAMICSSGYTMSRLSGMWTGEFMPGWRSMYTMDANVNLQSSGINTANIEQFGEGYINFILRQVDDWKINAEKCYGMTDAIMCPVNTDGDGALNAEYCQDYPFQYWNAGASWMIEPIYEYYQCYGNVTINTDEGEKQLLQDILLPLLTLQANFWDQLTTPEYYTDKDGNACYQKGKTELADDEKYLIIPSYSPENKTGGDTYSSTLAANSAIDISASKTGLQMTIKVENATKTQGYKERVEHWQQLLDKLPDYTYDETGAIKEWCANQYEENNKHRHISHLYVAWPSFETQYDEKLADAALTAIGNRQKENSASHGFVHQALVYARLKQGDEVYDILHSLLKSRICYTSLMTDHNTNRGSDTYCTDTEFGFVGIVDESLLFSNTGEIDILPALPSKWDKGEITGLVARTNATVSIKWENSKATATIKSNIDQTIRVSCQGENKQGIKFKAGEEKTIEFQL